MREDAEIVATIEDVGVVETPPTAEARRVLRELLSGCSCRSSAKDLANAWAKLAQCMRSDLRCEIDDVERRLCVLVEQQAEAIRATVAHVAALFAGSTEAGSAARAAMLAHGVRSSREQSVLDALTRLRLRAARLAEALAACGNRAAEG